VSVLCGSSECVVESSVVVFVAGGVWKACQRSGVCAVLLGWLFLRRVCVCLVNGVCGCLFLLGCVECGGGSALCLCVCVLCSPVSMSWALFLCWV